MTSIEWTHRPGTTGESWNPIRARLADPRLAGRYGRTGHYCVHATEGCRFCYAERMNLWRGNGAEYAAQRRNDVEIVLDDKTLHRPFGWKKPRTVFVCSMTDLFGEFHPDALIDRVFAVMALSPSHTFLVLTKRAKRMADYMTPFDQRRADALGEAVLGLDDMVPLESLKWPLPNVWLGVSVHDQESADQVVPELLATPAARRFVSYEPALGPVDFTTIGPEKDFTADVLRGWQDFQAAECPRLDWVICGGESGPDARPMHPDWPRAVRDQCKAAGAPFFFKQWGEWAPYKVVPGGDLGGDVRAGRAKIVHPSGRSILEIAEATGGRSTEPGSRYMGRVGKAVAGRLLDGAEHSEWPDGGAAQDTVGRRPA